MPEDILQFLWNAHNVLFSALIHRMPLRGAVTRGELLLSRDRRFFLGPAALEALELERAQEWSGACVSPGLVAHIESLGLTKELFPLLLPYDVPWKSNSGCADHGRASRATHALNWVTDPTSFLNPEFLRTKFPKPSAQDAAVVERKISNTADFLRHALCARAEREIAPENRRTVLDSYDAALGGRAIRFVLTDAPSADTEPSDD